VTTSLKVSPTFTGPNYHVQAASLQFREIQNIVDQPMQMLAAFMNVTDVAALAVIQQAIAFLRQEFGEAENGIKWRPEFVTHHG